MLPATVAIVSLTILWSIASTWFRTRRSAALAWRERIAMFSREAAVRWFNLMLWPSCLFDARRPGPGRPVLLVPHPSHSRIQLLWLHAYLARRGYAAWPMRLATTQADSYEAAEAVHIGVRRLCRWSRTHAIDVVAFDGGGLAVARYLHEHTGHTRIDRFIAIGVPWTDAARAQVAETVVYSVFCPQDPSRTQTIHDVTDPDRCTAITGAGHEAMLCSARVLRAVHHRLSCLP